MSGSVAYRRGLSLMSFLTCCASLALLLAALSTQHWISGRAHRQTDGPNDSDGRIHLGLFLGHKELNVGYGWRHFDINVVQLLSEDRNFMSYGLWLTTIASLCLGILFALLSAVFALVNSATTPVEMITGIPGLYVWNSLSFLCVLGSVVSWSVQYHLRLRANILSIEDRENLWSSEGLAVLGFSFWFLLGSAIVHLLNLSLVFIATKQGGRERLAPLKPIGEEKSNGAIMLY